MVEIDIETSEGDKFSGLRVTELGMALYRVEEGGGFLSDLIDYGDVVRLKLLEGRCFLLLERVESSRYKRTDYGIPRHIDIANPEVSAYLAKVNYWELNYGGWLTVYVSPDSTLDPSEELTSILKRISGF